MALHKQTSNDGQYKRNKDLHGQRQFFLSFDLPPVFYTKKDTAPVAVSSLATHYNMIRL